MTVTSLLQNAVLALAGSRVAGLGGSAGILPQNQQDLTSTPVVSTSGNQPGATSA